MERLEELTATYLDGALSPAETLELDNHLRADPLAARQFAEFYAQDRMLGELHRSEDVRAIESIMADVRREEGAFVGSVMEQVRQQRPQLTVGGMAVALTWLQRLCRSRLAWIGATAMLLIGAYHFVLFPVEGRPVLLTGPGSVVRLERDGAELPAFDGLKLLANDILMISGTNSVGVNYNPEKTRIELLPGTTLRLLDWAKGKHFDLRQGKLEASVAHQRPFKAMLVRTPEAEARVLGTRFSLTTATNRTQLDVDEGLVRLTRRSDGTAVKVSAGQYAIVAGRTELNALPQTGSILHEYWTNLSGSAVNDLLDHADYPDRPNGRDYVDLLEVPMVGATNYGCRLVGFLHPPVTGPYIFWIAASPEAAVNLSKDENPANAVRIFGTSFDFGRGRESQPREWERKATSSRTRSQPITLVAGRRYYIEAVHKADDRGGHLAIAWTPPGGEREVIAGRYLSPLKPKPTSKKP